MVFKTNITVPNKEIWNKVKKKVLDKNYNTISEYIFYLIEKDIKSGGKTK